MGVLTGLKPEKVFQFFEEICGIPHGSTDTKRISDYCVDFAKERGLRWLQDDANNVIIWKDGTEGYENSAPVMIQGHLDMVCEKEDGCDIDFASEGLRLRLDGTVISAEGTTLGGDDGIAVAYGLALLDAEDIPHPPLEVVFTVDEEIGMLGAAALDASPLKSRIMLNCDSEEEGYLLVSCAGGMTATCHLPIVREKSQAKLLRLTVSGCAGGHSGTEIDKGRINACQMLGRVLFAIKKHYFFQLVRVEGGLKDNAIPRSACAELVMDPDTDLAEVRELVSGLEADVRMEYRLTDPDVAIRLEEAEATGGSIQAMSFDSTDRVTAGLVCLPGGIQRMSFDMPGLVQTSLNLGILKTEDLEVTYSYSVRSSVESEKWALYDKLACLTEGMGGMMETQGVYPAWEYRADSPLRDLMSEVFEEQYGRKPVIQALHAGVECGLFAGKLPGLDCVSFGPNMKDIHTPKECMDAESVKRTWDYLLEILRRLK